MKSARTNFFRILIIVLLSCGLLYSYFNVLRSQFRSSARKSEIAEIMTPILAKLEGTDRLSCQSTVYIKAEQESVQDPSQSAETIHDFKHQSMKFVKENEAEILSYKGDMPILYTKGISPVYKKEDVALVKVPFDKWFRYPCEKMYGSKQKEGESEIVSYGYLMSDAGIMDLKAEGKEEINGKECRKYTASIKNTVRHMKGEQQGSNLFRKTLGKYGIDSIELQNTYPEVYDYMKEIYNQDSENLVFWVDEENKITRIEKDYTFVYYMNILKENSEKIEAQVGQYGYPPIICRQDYQYSPTCPVINYPKDYQEL